MLPLRLLSSGTLSTSGKQMRQLLSITTIQHALFFEPSQYVFLLERPRFLRHQRPQFADDGNQPTPFVPRVRGVGVT